MAQVLGEDPRLGCSGLGYRPGLRGRQPLGAQVLRLIVWRFGVLRFTCRPCFLANEGDPLPVSGAFGLVALSFFRNPASDFHLLEGSQTRTSVSFTRQVRRAPPRRPAAQKEPGVQGWKERERQLALCPAPGTDPGSTSFWKQGSRCFRFPLPWQRASPGGVTPPRLAGLPSVTGVLLLQRLRRVTPRACPSQSRGGAHRARFLGRTVSGSKSLEFTSKPPSRRPAPVCGPSHTAGEPA